MLKKATKYPRDGGIGNIRFARSRVERLPFSDNVFDGVTCSGAPYLFQDTVEEALSEMARVMKTGARLAVMTFVKAGLSAFKMILERLGTSNPFSQESL